MLIYSILAAELMEQVRSVSFVPSGAVTKYVVPMNKVAVGFYDKSKKYPTGKIVAKGVLSINTATNVVATNVVAQGTVPKTAKKVTFWSPTAYPKSVVSLRDGNFTNKVPFAGKWTVVTKATAKAAGKYKFSGTYKLAAADLAVLQQYIKMFYLNLQVISPNFFEGYYYGQV